MIDPRISNYVLSDDKKYEYIEKLRDIFKDLFDDTICKDFDNALESENIDMLSIMLKSLIYLLLKGGKNNGNKHN